jgi:site-specific DNA recombinase
MTSGALIPMIGYWRVSLGREDMISGEIQIQTGTDWAGRNGRRIIHWVEDPDDTGKNFERQVAKAIAGVEAGDATEIGVVRYDRWGRDSLECLLNLKRVRDAGGDVISWTEPFDAKTAIGKFSRTQAFAIAQLQSDQIGEAWKAAHDNRVARELPATGTPRFGYQRLGRVPDPVRAHVYRRDMADPAGERYVPDAETGPVLAEMYERYAAGEGPRSLARDLNSRGFTTTRGTPWSHTTLIQVLASGFGAGLLRVHDPACRCGRTTHQCKRILYLPGAQEPVIDPATTWEAFRGRLEDRRTVPPRLHEPAYPLSGLLICGTCRHRLTIVYNYSTPGWGYRCPRHTEHGDCATGVFVRRTAAEAAVLDWLRPLAADIETQAATASARQRTVKRAKGERARLAAAETKLVNRLARLVTQQADDDDAPAGVYEKARADTVTELEDVRAKLAASARDETANSSAYIPVVAGLLAEWGTFPPGRRRVMLGHLIREIRVHKTGYRKPPRIQVVPVWEPVE